MIAQGLIAVALAAGSGGKTELRMPSPPEPRPPAEPVKLASPGFTSVNMSQDLAAFYSDHFAQQLTLNGIRVITANEISSLVGFERQRQLLQCSSNSCTAELANALGVDGIITGSIGKFEDSYQLNVKILSATDGRPLTAFSKNVVGDKRFLAELTAAAERLAPELMRRFNRLTPAAKPSAPSTTEISRELPPPSGSRRLAWIPAAAGVALTGLGIYAIARVSGDVNALTNPTPGMSPSAAASLRDDGKTFQPVGFAALGIGIAALAAGGAMFVWGGANAQASASVAPGYAGLSLTVRVQ